MSQANIPNLTPGDSTLLRDELFVAAVLMDDGRLHGLCIQPPGWNGPGVPLIGSRTSIARSLEKIRKSLGINADRVRVIRFTKGDDCTAGFELGGN